MQVSEGTQRSGLKDKCYLYNHKGTQGGKAMEKKYNGNLSREGVIYLTVWHLSYSQGKTKEKESLIHLKTENASVTMPRTQYQDMRWAGQLLPCAKALQEVT